ncbi:unnamed protein product [Absidia cylindrospora]
MDKFPAVVLEHKSPVMRKMMQGSAKSDEARPSPARLEMKPDHAVTRGLYQIHESNPDLAKMVAEQIYDNAL